MNQFHTPIPELQVAFFQRLEELRKTYLLESLQSIVSKSDITIINNELNDFVSHDILCHVAGWSIRGEVIFPIPYLLKKRSQLLGYYRLLLGFSQKQFYGNLGFGRFKAMEESGRLSEINKECLTALCKALCESAEYLVGGVKKLSHESIHELTLLTLGPQLRGGALNLIGAAAVHKIFLLIKTIISKAIMTFDRHSITLTNAAGRIVKVEFSSDPDICIREHLASGKTHNLVAIEIKGGRDISNIHNRIGEAEKSHQKARRNGFIECWTMVGVTRLNHDLAKKESPTTDRFFHIDTVANTNTPEFREFKESLLSRLGITD